MLVPSRTAKPVGPGAFLSKDDQSRRAVDDDEMTGLHRDRGKRAHQRRGDVRQFLRGGRAVRGFEELVGHAVAIAAGILVQPAAPVEHDDHAEEFADRPREAGGDFADRQAVRFAREQFDDVDRLFQRGRRIDARTGAIGVWRRRRRGKRHGRSHRDCGRDPYAASARTRNNNLSYLKVAGGGVGLLGDVVRRDFGIDAHNMGDAA